MSNFELELQAAARLPVLLVASDYDGTLAEIVADPSQARPHREALVALRALSALPRTHVAVISGRSLKDLAELIGPLEDTHLVGSHGSEFDLAFERGLPPEATQLRDTIRDELQEIADRVRGLSIEEKPASIAFHYRNAPEGVVDEILAAVREGPSKRAGVHTRDGKKVVELAVVPTHKGLALDRLRHHVGASGAVFFGDDVTDEDAFATMSGPDLAVKVGDGETRATHRISGPLEVARVLGQLYELRRAWLAGSAATPIEAHSFLSDQRTAALITPEGRLSWFCAPRLDSPALFADLLGGEVAGRFDIRAEDGSKPIEQRYLPGTLMLETRWSTFRVTDYLDCSGGRPVRRAGRSELLRVIEGRGRGEIVFAPRVDFGRAATCIKLRENGLALQGTADPIVLYAPGLEWSIEKEGAHDIAIARFELDFEPIVLDLRYGTPSLRPAAASEPQRRNATHDFWAGWSQRLELPRIESALVKTSALTLKGLCYGPTGGIFAAATTSLPEHLGGVRNWDYRYVWLRDAALSAEALTRLGSYQEAMQYLDWVLGVLDSCEGPEFLRPLYSATGGGLFPEAEIAELAGYAGSRPVRVGNAAASQVQLDVFGPIANLIFTLVKRGAPLSAEHFTLMESLACAVERRWEEPDHGIWEIRGEPRHHVYSKIQCWVTVDRAERLARHIYGEPRNDWRRLADTIKQDVLKQGWKPDLRAFSAAYDGDDLDAAVLHIGLSGLLAPDDERFASTVDAIAETLHCGPTVYRYRSEDGLPGREGGFHLCTSWLIDALHLLGREREARDLFDELVALAGPTGLFPEQYDPRHKRSLGNHPQAYSHLGLIMNALNLSDAP